MSDADRTRSTLLALGLPLLVILLVLSAALDFGLAYRAAQFSDDDWFDRVGYLWIEGSFLLLVLVLGSATLRGNTWGRWALIAVLAAAAAWRLTLAVLPASASAPRIMLAAWWGLVAWTLAAVPGLAGELTRRRRRRYRRLLGPLDGREDAERWLRVADAWRARGILLRTDQHYVRDMLTQWLEREQFDGEPWAVDFRRRIDEFAHRSRAPVPTPADT